MANSKNMIFMIGGIDLGLSINTGWALSPLGRFPDFTSNNIPQAIYRVVIKPSFSEPNGTLLFDSKQSWRLYNNQNRRMLWVGSRDYIPTLVGDFSSDYHSGEIYVTKSKIDQGKYVFPLSYPLGGLLMTSLLGTGYGIMLHSCGVIDGGNGIVFAGTSSTGKTTTARLWHENHGVRVINDDHTIIRKIDSQFRVYSTPWHGQGGYALAEDAPLKKIFILKQSQANQANLLSPVKAAAALLVRSFPPLWDASAMAFTLQFLDDLCQIVPCYELGFVPDQSAVEYVRCLSTD
jgi:hypothetical protein